MHISFNIFRDSDFLEENISDSGDILKKASAGIMKYIRDMTVFTNATVNSFNRLGEYTAPRYIMWSGGENSQLIRMSSESGDAPVVLRSADCACNPYFVFGLMIYAALEGIESSIELPEENSSTERLPATLAEAADCAGKSEFLKKYIDRNILDEIIAEREAEWKEYSSAYDKEAFEEQKFFYNL